MSRAYGKKVGEYFDTKKTSLLIRSSALQNHVAATYLHSNSGTGFTDPIPAEAALLIAVQLAPLETHELWIDGRKQPSPSYQRGAVTLLDLRCRPVANLASAYECVQLYMPLEALAGVAEAEEQPVLNDVPMLLGSSDPVLASFGQIAAFAVSPPGPASSLLLETTLVGVFRHISKQYIGRNSSMLRVIPKRTGPRLSAHQQRELNEYLDAFLESDIGLMQLSKLAKMSPSSFSKAFKNSMGTSPKQWLQERRLSRARQLMIFSDKSLTEIASECGFYDQSHFNRIFRMTESLSPSHWRKLHGRRKLIEPD